MATTDSGKLAHDEIPLPFLNSQARNASIRHLLERKSIVGDDAPKGRQSDQGKVVTGGAVTVSECEMVKLEEKEKEKGDVQAGVHASSDKTYSSSHRQAGVHFSIPDKDQSRGRLYRDELHEGDDLDVDNIGTSAAINLRVRDLRRLDFIFHPTQEPSVWVRRHAVLFCLDPIRAVVMASRIIIIVPQGGMDQIMQILERYMTGTVHTYACWVLLSVFIYCSEMLRSYCSWIDLVCVRVYLR
jgi:hypothetical protein